MISCGTSSNFETLTLLKRKKFCRFPHRHGEGRGNPETQNETCWSIKTSISWEAFFNFDTLTLSKRKTRNMKRDMLEHQSEHFMRDVLQVWHVDTIKKKGFTCGLVHLNLATLEPKKTIPKMPWWGRGSPFWRSKSDFGVPNLYRIRNLPNMKPHVPSTLSGYPTPCFLLHFCDYKTLQPLQSGEPVMSLHASRMGTWNKSRPQKYKRVAVKEPWSLPKTLESLEVNIICIC